MSLRLTLVAFLPDCRVDGAGRGESAGRLRRDGAAGAARRRDLVSGAGRLAGESPGLRPERRRRDAIQAPLGTAVRANASLMRIKNIDPVYTYVPWGSRRRWPAS